MYMDYKGDYKDERGSMEGKRPVQVTDDDIYNETEYQQNSQLPSYISYGMHHI